MMIFVNDCYKAKAVNRDMLLGFIKVLSPITPHICEEIYSTYTGKETLAYESWPSYDPKKLELTNVTIAVQVNGKMRARFEAPKDSGKEVLEQMAMDLADVKKHTEGKTVRKVIVIPNKIVNIVVS
jgi:leucyl-tRNA synthetase